VIPTYLNLLEAHPSDAAILVMPDTDGGQQYGLQCLNNPGGIQDLTFVAEDVPNYIARFVRVQAPGPAWGVAGYSEGGYCAANIALQEPGRYGAAGIMSGYFVPIQSQVPKGNKPGGEPYAVNVFAGDPALQLVNTPSAYLTKIPVNIRLPAFWFAAGAQDKADVSAAASFRQQLQTRELLQARELLPTGLPPVPFMIVPDGGHQGSVWRAALGPMLAWMTPQLAAQAAKADAAVASAAAQRKAHPVKSPTTPPSAPPSAPPKK
jgi:S-formylglutathione hydrolase FrmB